MLPAIALRRLNTAVHLLSSAVPHGDAMPIPNLAADAPVVKVLYPMEIGFIEVFRNNGNLPALYGILHPFPQRGHIRSGALAIFSIARKLEMLIHVHEPLLFYLRLNDTAAAVILGDAMDIVFINTVNEIF